MNDLPYILPLEKWIGNANLPLVVSGPCSAETHDQVLATAHALAKIPAVRIFRAGIWKPRTRPGSFEGVGENGLVWLRDVKAETGLMTAVEVANPGHIEVALKNEVDILWVGARTVVNPFSVQELASAVSGAGVPVMIKNPVNPDLGLWIGAIERFSLAGIKKIIAVHRGFYFFDRSPYRNAPMWEIPIELKRRIPGLPVICDPSHICGEREKLFEVSQKALDLEMDGLMIESHINPDQALTDKFQQIKPEELDRLLARLVIRKEHGNKEFESKLEELRAEIDKIDAELIHILSKRMELVDEIGHYKRDHNITILQLKRWTDLVKNRLERGIQSDLSEAFLKKLLDIVHSESIRRQTDIYKNRNGAK
ncbi:MAG: bifunctional 3-deoxy-7-phosphoheptulonate synthase/chorismate mutase type II [Bacteroidales bacterium]|nr:bifunctional 3-deoxy-7-phosphoheptulonate synthase/chorismate mutase type II [Bacteroidales bacterium]